jgi:hypothetical protein
MQREVEKYEFEQLCYRNRDGMNAIQADRQCILPLAAVPLHQKSCAGARLPR